MTSPIQPLLSDAGRALLAHWQATPGRQAMTPLEQSNALRRRGASADLAAAILTQCDLRDRALGKFGPLAERLLLTRDGFEQATRRRVAERHAQRYLAAGASHIADLGCGNGADAVAFLGAGVAVTAVDIDEDAVACTRWNLHVVADTPNNDPNNSPNDAPNDAPNNGPSVAPRDALAGPVSPTFSVLRADVTTLDVPALASGGVDAIFADPARRTGATRGSSRLASPEQWSPPLSTVLSWLGTYDRVGVKVAPGIDYEAIPADFQAEWTSVDGDLVEAALWSPALSPEGPGRQATVIHDTRVHVLSERGCPSAPADAAPVVPLGRYIAEPDGAVIRAGLVARVAADVGMGIVSPRIAYLTGDEAFPSPFVRYFEVIDVVALKPKAIASALRGVQAHSIEVKKRGADVDPVALRQSVRKALCAKGPGSQDVTVIVTRVGGRHQAVLARRL